MNFDSLRCGATIEEIIFDLKMSWKVLLDFFELRAGFSDTVRAFDFIDIVVISFFC